MSSDSYIFIIKDEIGYKFEKFMIKKDKKYISVC
jgi:hypothetical protein